jgi:hypothetical protein
VYSADRLLNVSDLKFKRRQVFDGLHFLEAPQKFVSAMLSSLKGSCCFPISPSRAGANVAESF